MRILRCIAILASAWALVGAADANPADSRQAAISDEHRDPLEIFNNDPSSILKIHADLGIPAHELMTRGLLLLPDGVFSTGPDGAALFQLRASALLNDETSSASMDSVVAWWIEGRAGAPNATIDETGLLRMPEFGVVHVLAVMEGVGPHEESAQLRVEYTGDDLFTGFRMAEPRDADDVQLPPPTPEQLTRAAKVGVHRLVTRYGLSSHWGYLLGRARLYACSTLGDGYRGPKILVAYHNGIRYSSASPWGGLYSPTHTIIIGDDDARTIVEEGIFTPEGLLNGAGARLLHAITRLHARRLPRMNIPLSVENELAEEVETSLINSALRLHNLLREIGDAPPDEQQRHRARDLMEAIKSSVQQSHGFADNFSDRVQKDYLEIWYNLTEGYWADNVTPSIIELRRYRQYFDNTPAWLQEILDEMFPSQIPSPEV